jgi:hypothetical protein
LNTFEIFQTVFDLLILLAFVLFVRFLLKVLKSILGNGQEEASIIQGVTTGETPPPTYSESWINPYWDQEATSEQEDQEASPTTGLRNGEINIEIHSAPSSVFANDEMGYDTVDK